jgi:hypothetical protein
VVGILTLRYLTSCQYGQACETYWNYFDCELLAGQTGSYQVVALHQLLLPNPVARKHFLRIPGHFPGKDFLLNFDGLSNPAFVEGHLQVGN